MSMRARTLKLRDPMKCKISVEVDVALVYRARQAVQRFKRYTVAGIVEEGMRRVLRSIERGRRVKLKPLDVALPMGRPRGRRTGTASWA